MDYASRAGSSEIGKMLDKYYAQSKDYPSSYQQKQTPPYQYGQSSNPGKPKPEDQLGSPGTPPSPVNNQGPNPKGQKKDLQPVQPVSVPADQKKDKNAKTTKNSKNETVPGSQSTAQFGQDAYWQQPPTPEASYKQKPGPATQPPQKEPKKIQGYVPEIAIMAAPKETKKQGKQQNKKQAPSNAGGSQYGHQDPDPPKSDYWNELSQKEDSHYGHSEKPYDDYSSKRGNQKSKHLPDDQRTVSGKMKFDDKYSNYESSKGYPKTGESDHHTEHTFSEHSAAGPYPKAPLPDFKGPLPPNAFYHLPQHQQHSYYGKEQPGPGPGPASKKGKHLEDQNPYMHPKYPGKPDRMDPSNYSLNQQPFFGAYNYSQVLDFLPPQQHPANRSVKNMPVPFADPRQEIFGTAC